MITSKIKLGKIVAMQVAAIVAATVAFSLPAASSDSVNIYSARKEALILPLLERFRDDTGIEFNLVTGKADELLKRIELEGEATPADVFITVDAGRLHRAKERQILQPIESAAVDAAVPLNLRDRDGYWVSLSQRARTVFYAVDRVDASKLSTYEGLVDPQWKGRICIRSSGNIYNQSLVASMIEAADATQAAEWAEGMVANFARPPTGGDTDQLRAAAAGECDIAIANTYYFGRLAASEKQADRDVAKKLRVFWPNQGEGERGVHVNVSGIGIVAHTKHRDAALRLIEYLIRPESQNWYAKVNHEYPVVAGVAVSDTLKQLGQFKADSVNLTALGTNNREAVKVMDQAGWR